MKNELKTIYALNYKVAYKAKQRIVNAAIEFFRKNPNEYLVNAVLSWFTDIVNGKFIEQPKRISFVVRRELISHYIKVEFVNNQELANDLLPKHKSEYLELFNLLYDNQINKK